MTSQSDFLLIENLSLLDKSSVLRYTQSMQCGLCQKSELKLFHRDERRHWDYYVCQNCDFLFRDPKTYLDASQEEVRYSTHNNSIESPGYVKFLSPTVETLMPHLKPTDQGLDFGSGPGPILDILFARQNIKISNYDPYFDNHPELLNKQYDFVTCTEVFEHFYTPFKEMNKINEILKPKGFLILMTEMRRDLEHFKGWGYRTDNTHVCFLNEKSLQWLSENWGYKILSSDGRISSLQKK